MHPETRAVLAPRLEMVAYSRVALEYDQATHRTTRALEALCGRGLKQAYAQAALRTVGHVLEVGAGTGALTRTALTLWPDAEILATDPSAEMIEVFKRRISASHANVAVAPADVATAGRLWDVRWEVVLAGLADPYLDRETAEDLLAACDQETCVFVSVPSRRWATRERRGRLGIDINHTRFRLGDGSAVFAPSSTYDLEQLRELLQDVGFSIMCSGTEQSTTMWTHPEVCWALARPAVSG